MLFNSQTIQKLKIAFAKRDRIREVTNALRLVNGTGDSLEGLIIEQYDRHFVVQVFDPFWLENISRLKKLLEETFTVDYLIIKDRTKSTSADSGAMEFQVLIQKTDSKTIIQENGLRFEVDLNDTLNTGLFLDMRSNRKLVSQTCSRQRVLNCFSYTCSFGVYARAQGAKEVVNVDVSKKILEKGKLNYKLNDLEPGRSEFIKADAVEFLGKAVKKENFFDVIVLDPPSFARSEKAIFRVEKSMPALIDVATRILNQEGKIFISTNFSGISHARLEEYLKQSTKGRMFKKVTRLGQDKDFVGSDHSKESHLAAIWVEF